MTTARDLVLTPPPPDRVMDAEEISQEFTSGKWSARMVRERVPGRIPGMREAAWFRSRVEQYFEALRRKSA